MRFTAVFLIALVGMSLAAQYTSPADQVLEKVDALVTASKTEQSQQARLYLEQSNRCKTERVFRNKEITDGEVAKGGAAQQLSICSVELPVATASHVQSKSELAASKAQLVAVNAEHDIFTSVNAARQTENTEMLASISTAYNIIGNFANGKEALSNQATFVQVTQQINKAFRIAIRHRNHHLYMPVMSALVQLTAAAPTTVSSATLTNLVQKLRELEANVRKSEDKRAEVQKVYEAQFSSQVELLEQQKVALAKIIKQYTNYIAALNKCISTETVTLNAAEAKISRNTGILEATIKMCDAYDLKYKTQTEQRTAYATLLGQLRGFVVSTISSYKSGLYSRGDYVATL